MPFVNLLNDKDIDWEGNCIFENGKVVGFKVEKASNHRYMIPIPKDDWLIESAKVASKELDEKERPATPDQIAIELKKLSIHCGKTNKNAEETKYMLMDYCIDLKDYPIKLIAEACQKYRTQAEGNEFMPNAGKLKALMADKWHKMKFLRSRIDKILGVYVKPQEKQNRVLSLDEALEQLI